jgi:hypothetical protein
VRPGVVVPVWALLLLSLDTLASPAGEWLLGLATWLLLMVLLRPQTRLVRLQVAVVVAFATVVEYTFSAGLGVYTYRHGGVPAFVPPGHGLVYLGALDLGRTSWATRARPLAVALVTAWALWGLSPLAPRLDVLGAFWAVCLVLFLFYGRSTGTYVGAFLVVSWLEILGTGTGAWTWAALSPLHAVAQGNPPSGAAGGYGFFDAAALWLAPLIAVRLDHRHRHRLLQS